MSDFTWLFKTETEFHPTLPSTEVQFRAVTHLTYRGGDIYISPFETNSQIYSLVTFF